jgi:hypothetical protein
MLDLNHMYNTIDIKKLSLNTIIAYGASWLYFFISLPIIKKIFGTITGTTLNYLISWVIMLIVIYILHTEPIIKLI